MTTRPFHSRRSARIAIVMALATALLPLSAAIAEGYYYEATTVDQLENGKERSRSQVRGWIDGPAAKVEFADQKGTMFKPGSYLLTKDAGRTLYLVDPKEKAYSRWDLEAMLASTFALHRERGPVARPRVLQRFVEEARRGRRRRPARVSDQALPVAERLRHEDCRCSA